MVQNYFIQPSEVRNLTIGQLNAFLEEDNGTITFPNEAAYARWLAAKGMG